jgi:thiol:disulfide interchange protein DsbA
MKRREFALAATAGLPLWALAQGPAPTKPAPQEGIEYVTLEKRVPAESNDGKIEVIEFFWYSCPHCNAFEPRFAQWLKTTPKDVVVRRVPVAFREDFVPQQRLYYTLEAMNLVEKMHIRVFNAIHGEKLMLNSEATVLAWAEKQGIDKAKFAETYKSFGVAAKAKRAVQLQNDFKIEGVPSLGVAGRYYIDGTLAGNMDRALKVAEALIAQTRQGR